MIEKLERMEDAWDRLSACYSEHTELSPSDPHYRRLAEHLPRSESHLLILDLGSGLGFALDGILQRMPNARITCMDVSSEMLRGLVKRLSEYASRINTRHEAYTTADLGSNQFDFITASFTVHHLPESARLTLFKKICRALRSGGSYIELDGVASQAQEQAALQEFDNVVAQRGQRPA